jgi:hypothetical protein
MIQRGDIGRFLFAAPDKRQPVLLLGRPDMLPPLSQVPVIPDEAAHLHNVEMFEKMGGLEIFRRCGLTPHSQI